MPGSNAASSGLGTRTITINTTSTGLQPSPAIDCNGYRWVTVHLTTIPAGSTVEFMGANNDTATYYHLPLMYTRSTGPGLAVYGTAVDWKVSTVGLFHGPMPARWFRLNLAGAGTWVATVMLSSTPVAVIETGAATGGSGKTTPGLSSTSIAGSVPCRSVTLKAGRNNTGVMYITVSGNATAATGLELFPGETISVDIGNLTNISVLGTSATDYLTYLWVN